MLILDAQVPNPPANRALLWAALAIVAVVGLVFVVDQAPTGPSRPRDPSAVGAENENGGPAEKDKGKLVVGPKEDRGPAPAPDLSARTAIFEHPEGGRRAEPPRLAGPEPRRRQDRVAPRRHYRPLSAGRWNAARVGTRRAGTGDYQAAGPEKAADAAASLTMVWTPETSRWCAVTINAPNILVEGVRLHRRWQGEAPDTAMVSLLLQGKDNTRRGCEFVQVHPKVREEGKRLGSLVVEPGRKIGSKLKLYDCSLPRLRQVERGGQHAFRRGHRRSGCGGPPRGGGSGGQGLRVRPALGGIPAWRGDGGEDEEVKVQHCSVLLPARGSAVFEQAGKATARATAKLNVTHSLFSRLPGDTYAEGSVLLSQPDEAVATVSYLGRTTVITTSTDTGATGANWQPASWTGIPRSQARAMGAARTNRACYPSIPGNWSRPGKSRHWSGRISRKPSASTSTSPTSARVALVPRSWWGRDDPGRALAAGDDAAGG